MRHDPRRGEAGAVDKAEHRPEAVGGGRTDKVEPAHRGLEMARQDRRLLRLGDRAAQPLVEEAEPAQIDLVAGADDRMVGAERFLAAVEAAEPEVDPTVAR